MSDGRIEVTFHIEGITHVERLRPDEILHEAIDRLPDSVRLNRRLQFRLEDGREVFADTFAGSLADAGGRITVIGKATPVEAPATARPGVTYAFDHLAIAVADRPGARDFFSEALGLQVVRDDEHQTVLTSGPTALFLFDARPGIPLSDGLPSRIHHLGFVVEDLEASLFQVERAAGGRVSSDFTLLERPERWSLYFHYENGDVTFMIQLSEIKPEVRGLRDAGYTAHLYDYAQGPYGGGGKRAGGS